MIIGIVGVGRPIHWNILFAPRPGNNYPGSPTIPIISPGLSGIRVVPGPGYVQNQGVPGTRVFPGSGFTPGPGDARVLGTFGPGHTRDPGFLSCARPACTSCTPAPGAPPCRGVRAARLRVCYICISVFSILCRSGNCSGWPGDLVPGPWGSQGAGFGGDPGGPKNRNLGVGSS